MQKFSLIEDLSWETSRQVIFIYALESFILHPLILELEKWKPKLIGNLPSLPALTGR